MIWTSERIQELKKLWESGLSTGEIGKILGVSKNAIVGKVHRLALEGRPSPIASGSKSDGSKKSVKKKVVKKKAPAKTMATKANVSKPVKKETESTAEKTTETPVKKTPGVALVDLTPTSCRWPEGDPKDPYFSFCGKEVVPGKIYCAEHCAVAYSTLLKTK